MAATPSTMLPLGTQAPDFSLLNIDGRTLGLRDFSEADALLVMFICNHCPFVIHIREELAALGDDYQSRNVAVIAINSNDIEKYPADAFDKMKEEASSAGYNFPYLLDEQQTVAHAYRAACTPDFYLFDKGRALVYRGQLDASRPGNGVPVTGQDLREALNQLLVGKEISADQVPSIGCNIKWKPGNAPDYF
jgi:peroxiredoxin